jgi:hypothetical protein
MKIFFNRQSRALDSQKGEKPPKKESNQLNRIMSDSEDEEGQKFELIQEDGDTISLDRP